MDAGTCEPFLDVLVKRARVSYIMYICSYIFVHTHWLCTGACMLDTMCVAGISGTNRPIQTG